MCFKLNVMPLNLQCVIPAHLLAKHYPNEVMCRRPFNHNPVRFKNTGVEFHCSVNYSMVEDALIPRAEVLVAASYYGSVVSELSSAPNLWAGAVRTKLSTRLLSTAAALPAVLFIASLQHTPTALSPANRPSSSTADSTPKGSGRFLINAYADT